MHAGPAQRWNATDNQADGGAGATCRASIGRRGAALRGGDIKQSMELDIRAAIRAVGAVIQKRSRGCGEGETAGPAVAADQILGPRGGPWPKLNG